MIKGSKWNERDVSSANNRLSRNHEPGGRTFINNKLNIPCEAGKVRVTRE